VDYTKNDNWMFRSEKPVHAVDFIFLIGSVSGAATLPNGVTEISERMKKAACRYYYNIVEGLVDLVNLYAPYYRQLSLSYAATLKSKVIDDELYSAYIKEVQSKEPKIDVFSALDYYFETHNNNRPFILAGHSQGSVLLFSILEEYMKVHPEYYHRMIAAYAVGYGVSKQWLATNSHIRFSQSRDDIGVLLSWNTEGPHPEGQNILLAPDALVTNPITWKTDEIPASASDNLGALLQFRQCDTKKDKDVLPILKPGLYDATINRKRGSVTCTTNSQYMESIFFGSQSLHIDDYSLYYGNFRENIKERIASYLNQANLRFII